nr:peroxide stress protein YaaA [Brevibacterium daeguense]
MPPSEGKTPASAGPLLDLAQLSLPALSGPRTEVLSSLAEVSAAPDGRERLGVGAGLVEDVERNTRLARIPCAPALQTYTGVLYGALGRLTPTAQARLDDVWVSSALFGIVGALDPIPAYRLAMKTRLGEHGVLSSWWKPQLTPVLDVEFAGRLILDCRSADYRKSWPGPPERTALVNVFTEKNGRRTVVSHNAKHTRGELVGRLLRSRAALPGDFAGLVKAVRRSYQVEFTPPRGSRPAALDVIIPG